MALTASTMLPLGTKAPDFNLPEVVSGKATSLSTFADKKSAVGNVYLSALPICKAHPTRISAVKKTILQVI